MRPETVLQRVDDVLLDIDSAGMIRIHHDQRIVTAGHHTLSLMDVFSQPRTVADGLNLLSGRLRSRRAVEEAIRTLAQLRSSGIITEPTGASFSRRMFPYGGYGMSMVNIAMLDDPMRKSSFIDAIEATVTAQDVVLDLGTGCGILAIAAARAGAKKVYAVEPARTSGLAAEVAAANGVADRISFVRGWSTLIELEERCTVLTTDILGNEIFDMSIWETVQDARERLLTEDAALIPCDFVAYVYLVKIDAGVMGRQRIAEHHIKQWFDRYRIDFSPLLESDGDRVVGFYERPEVVSTWEPHSEPTQVFEASLRDSPRRFTGSVKVQATRSGEVDGVVLYFTSELAEDVTLSTRPSDGGPRSHWWTACWAMPRPAFVRAGEELDVSYTYEGDGNSRLDVRYAGSNEGG